MDDREIALIRLGAEAYAELLRGVQNMHVNVDGLLVPLQTGTDTQAYDHIIRRMQDLHGSYVAQIEKAVQMVLDGEKALWCAEAKNKCCPNTELHFPTYEQQVKLGMTKEQK